MKYICVRHPPKEIACSPGRVVGQCLRDGYRGESKDVNKERLARRKYGVVEAEHCRAVMAKMQMSRFPINVMG